MLTLHPHQQVSLDQLREETRAGRYRDVWYVYILIDPRTDLVRYVGITSNPPMRLRGHVSDSKLRETTHKSRWIRQLLAKSLRPVMEIVESGIGDQWAAAETKWVQKYWASGNLTNQTMGGDKGPFFVSEETRLKHSVARLGQKHFPAAIENMRRAQKGLKKTRPTPAMNDRMSNFHPFKNKDRCSAGHVFDESNTYYTVRESNGRPKRACRKCRALRQRAYKARKRAASS